MKKIRKRFLYNFPESLKLYFLFKKLSPYTLLKYDALYQIYQLLNKLDDEQIEGAVVEMGCWSGGAGALMSWQTKRNNTNRRVWLFDSFEGLPELTKEDKGRWANKTKLKIKEVGDASLRSTGKYKADKEKVYEILDIVNVKKEVEVIKGWFQKTIPGVKERLKPIALLRLDADIYESTIYCLDELYDLVAPGGYIIIDDFHLAGCRRAVYEFFYKRNLNIEIFNNPYWGRAYFKKIN